MLRTTFHMDDNAQDISQSYMAVHDSASCIQNVQVVGDDAALARALRLPFHLSTEFPSGGSYISVVPRNGAALRRPTSSTP